MTTSEVSSGVSNCYVFKNRLHEYAQKNKLPTPVYETVQEGLSHKPSFQSTVIVDGVRYNSLPGFFNRKAAEQSAAEVALQDLAKSSEINECVSQPIHEMGNLLQEYAQKMNYSIPSYHCQESEALVKVSHFTCTVEIGGKKYTGAATRSKKDAEISAERTALLAIQSKYKSNIGNCKTQFTVLPCEKRTLDEVAVKESIKTPIAMRAQFKRKVRKEKRNVAKDLARATLHCKKDQPENAIMPLQLTQHCQNDQPENAIMPLQPTQHCQNDQSENVIVPPEPTQHCQNDQSENIEPSLNPE